MTKKRKWLKALKDTREAWRGVAKVKIDGQEQLINTSKRRLTTTSQCHLCLATVDRRVDSCVNCDRCPIVKSGLGDTTKPMYLPCYTLLRKIKAADTDIQRETLVEEYIDEMTTYVKENY